MQQQTRIAALTIKYYLPLALIIIAVFVYLWQKQEYEHRDLFTLTYDDNRFNIECTVNGVYDENGYVSDTSKTLEPAIQLYARVTAYNDLKYPVLYSNDNLFIYSDTDTIYVDESISDILNKPHHPQYHALYDYYDRFEEEVWFNLGNVISFEDLKKMKLGYDYTRDSISTGLKTKETKETGDE